jgi:hypothetical protein
LVWSVVATAVVIDEPDMPLLTLSTRLLPSALVSYVEAWNRSITTRVRPAASTALMPAVEPVLMSTWRCVMPLRVSDRSIAMRGGLSVVNTCGSPTGPANFITICTLPPASGV